MYILDGAMMGTREKAHTHMAEAMGFPAYYGANLDALYDCLTDLTEVTVFLRNAGAMTESGHIGYLMTDQLWKTFSPIRPVTAV